EICAHVGEDDLVARLVEHEAHEPAPDVARTEVHRLHQALTSPRMSRISSALVAASIAATSSSSENTIAILERISRCWFSTPAMPTTKCTGLPSQSMAWLYLTNESAEVRIASLLSFVPCGMARKFPM